MAQYFSNAKERIVNSKSLYLATIFFGNAGEIKTFSATGKLREFVINRPNPKGMGKGRLLTESKW